MRGRGLKKVALDGKGGVEYRGEEGEEGHVVGRKPLSGCENCACAVGVNGNPKLFPDIRVRSVEDCSKGEGEGGGKFFRISEGFSASPLRSTF